MFIVYIDTGANEIDREFSSLENAQKFAERWIDNNPTHNAVIEDDNGNEVWSSLS